MRNTISFALVLASATTARAQAADLGTPLPAHGAAPALAGVGLGMGFDATYEAVLPTLSLSNSARVPRRSATLAGFGVEEYYGGRHPGWFGFTTLGCDFDFDVAGGADDFTANASKLDSGDLSLLRFRLPSIGYGYRNRNWLGAVQLVPSIEWFSTDYKTPAMTYASGSEVSLAVGIDAEVCKQWNLGGVFSKNSATCVYAAPIVYRDGFMAGASFGVRVFPF